MSQTTLPYLNPTEQWALESYIPKQGWFTPPSLSPSLHRRNYICERLHKKGVLEQRWAGGVVPTLLEITTKRPDEIYEYRRLPA